MPDLQCTMQYFEVSIPFTSVGEHLTVESVTTCLTDLRLMQFRDDSLPLVSIICYITLLEESVY